MVLDDEKDLVLKYSVRFGKIAVEKGYITEDNLFEAIGLQVEEDLNDIEHRLLGTILFDMGVMSEEEIKEVLKELFKSRSKK
jgi:hypothetical protein